MIHITGDIHGEAWRFCEEYMPGESKWTGWAKIKTTNSTTTYTDRTAKKGVTYKYTIRAISDSNKGYYNTSGLQVKDKY